MSFNLKERCTPKELKLVYFKNLLVSLVVNIKSWKVPCKIEKHFGNDRGLNIVVKLFSCE